MWPGSPALPRATAWHGPFTDLTCHASPRVNPHEEVFAENDSEPECLARNSAALAEARLKIRRRNIRCFDGAFFGQNDRRVSDRPRRRVSDAFWRVPKNGCRIALGTSATTRRPAVSKGVDSRRVSPLDEFWYGSITACADFYLDRIGMFAYRSRDFNVTHDTPTCVASVRPARVVHKQDYAVDDLVAQRRRCPSPPSIPASRSSPKFFQLQQVRLLANCMRSV